MFPSQNKWLHNCLVIIYDCYDISERSACIHLIDVSFCNNYLSSSIAVKWEVAYSRFHMAQVFVGDFSF